MHPYRLEIAEADVADLRDRLDRARWPVQLPLHGSGTKGLTVEDARGWAADLARLDVRAVQEELNDLPQWITRIDGADIHFVHVRSGRPGAIPLLLLHGWPGTVVELIDLVPELTSGGSGGARFDVVIPSHPGTGLSGRVSAPGWGVDRTARAYARLMQTLGYSSYVVQGGDHGAVLGPHVGRVDPERVLGVHVNAASLGFMPLSPVAGEARSRLSQIERHRLDLIDRFMAEGNGYNVIQATRPQTIGYGLEDSPLALLTWIIDKVTDWTHDPRLLEDRHYRDRHLTNVLIYWVTRTATSAANAVYAEYAGLFADPTAFTDSRVPTAVIAYAEDPSIRPYAEQSNSIVRWTDVDDGGHFAALEQPESLVADLRAFVRDELGQGR